MKAVAWLLLGSLVGASGWVAAATTVPVEVGHDDDQASASYLQFYPRIVVVHEEDTVQWTSHSDDPHTVTEGAPSTWNDPSYRPAFDSSPSFGANPQDLAPFFGPGGLVLPGQSFQHTFNATGDFEYRCKLHAPMHGWVHVVNGTALGLPRAGNASVGKPADVYVDAGDGSGDVSVDRYGPAQVTVPVGTTVVWTNKHSDEPHTITSNTTSEPFDSSPNAPDFTGPAPPNPPPPGFFGPGAVMFEFTNSQFNFTFPQAGIWQYHCKLHQGMAGAVIVLAAEPQANMTGSTSSGNNASGTTNAAGSRVPGVEQGLAIVGIAGAALALARRRS
jgi:plastocyanin